MGLIALCRHGVLMSEDTHKKHSDESQDNVLHKGYVAKGQRLKMPSVVGKEKNLTI